MTNHRTLSFSIKVFLQRPKIFKNNTWFKYWGMGKWWLRWVNCSFFGGNFEPDHSSYNCRSYRRLKVKPADETAVRTATLDLLLLTVSERKVVRQSGNILW
jgi:hypothetical protein